MTSWHTHMAARALGSGGLVLHATEGVWGIACDPFDGGAVAAVLAFKGRRPDKGLILIGAAAAMFADELAGLQADVRAQVEDTWPGPVTWVLANRRFPDWVCRNGSVAVRVPGHDQARALCAAFGGPLVSTSANRSGRRPARTRLQARRVLRDARRRGLLRSLERSVSLLPGETLGRLAPSEIRLPGGATLRAAR